MSYTLETKTIDASFPRAPGSTLISGDHLKLVYLRYKNKRSAPAGAIRYNFIFGHGTGMNKSIWKYHIDQLYKASDSGAFYVDSVASVDAVGHGDSGWLNANKLGYICGWDDHGKDLNTVLKHEQRTTGDFQNDLHSRTIGVGHSFSGCSITLAAFYEPDLYDSIIPIEPVIYYTHNDHVKYQKFFTKLSQILLDDFASLDDYNDYFGKFSIYKTFDQRVLADFKNDELVEVKDDAGDTHYKTKSSNFAQMACYFGSVISVPICMEIQPLIRVPVHHVTGKIAIWNPPAAIDHFRTHIQKRYLSSYDLEGGTHLLNGEAPDATVQIIADYVIKRQQTFLQARETYPEVQFKGDKQKIKDSEYPKLLTGDLLKSGPLSTLGITSERLSKM